MIKAKMLKKGDTIGVIAPASPSESPAEMPRAKAYLEKLGYKVVLGENVDKLKGFVAASEEARAHDLNEMFARDDIDAVFVTRGGYGSAQIINRIDFDNIRKHPKIFTGFSDITSLHLAIHKFAGLVTFHACGMARFNQEDMTEYTEKQFFKAVAQSEPVGTICLADERKWLHAVGTGAVEGTVLGGNLSLLCASMGTPYQPDLTDKILFIEDVDSEPWQFDGCLSHLRNAGILDQVKGIVVGECENCKPNDYLPGYLSDVHILDVLEYYTKPLNKPVLYGLPLGHTTDMAALPLGVSVRLDADNKTFTVLESGVTNE